MDFIANYWYAWLALMLISGVYALVNQIARFNRMRKDMDFNTGRADDAFFKGAGSLMVAVIVMWGSGILLLIAVVIHIIRYLNAA